MAQVPDQIKALIDLYIQKLEENKIPIQQAWLFGSYAKGTQNEWSDIDIALVSEVFAGNRFDDRALVRPITLSVSSDFEVHPFNPRDFVPENPWVQEILQTAIRLKQAT